MSDFDSLNNNDLDASESETGMIPEPQKDHRHEVRITILENNVGDIKATLKELMGDVKQLVSVMQRQADDRQALERAFAGLQKVMARIDEVEKRLEEEQQKRQQEKIDALQKEVDDNKNAKHEARMMLLKNGAALLAALLAYHFGIQLL